MRTRISPRRTRISIQMMKRTRSRNYWLKIRRAELHGFYRIFLLISGLFGKRNNEVTETLDLRMQVKTEDTAAQTEEYSKSQGILKVLFAMLVFLPWTSMIVFGLTNPLAADPASACNRDSAFGHLLFLPS